MRIIDSLRAQLADRLEGRVAADVRVGLGFTCVLLDNGHAGLAYTFRRETGQGCTVLDAAGGFAGRAASELAALAGGGVIETAIGLATLNAAAGPIETEGSADVIAALAVRDGERVGMVGWFGPVLKQLGNTDVTVFETAEGARPGTVPGGRMAELLPGMDVVIVTSTSLINNTADGILDHCGGAREVAMLGPSTPCVAAAFEGTPVTLLAGSQVTNSGSALRIVSEGGGTRQLGPACRKFCIRVAGA